MMMKLHKATSLAVTGVLMAGGLIMAPGVAFATEGPGAAKVFVCKYVGTPDVDERLQTGNNPISVSVNSIPNYTGIGSDFADSQGRSHVLAEDNRTGGGQEGEPSVDDCPPAKGAPVEGEPGDEEPSEETPEETPEETTPLTEREVALYLYKKIDEALPAGFLNAGDQTLVKYKEGTGWFSTLELPDNVCGPGWAFQQDEVEIPFGTNYNWPQTIPQGVKLIGSPPLVEDYHGVLSQLEGVVVPDCVTEEPPSEEEPVVPTKPAPSVKESSSRAADCTTKQIVIEYNKTTTDWVLENNAWVPAEPVISAPVYTYEPATAVECPVTEVPVPVAVTVVNVTTPAPVVKVLTPAPAPVKTVVKAAPVAHEKLAETGSEGLVGGLSLAGLLLLAGGGLVAARRLTNA